MNQRFDSFLSSIEKQFILLGLDKLEVEIFLNLKSETTNISLGALCFYIKTKEQKTLFETYFLATTSLSISRLKCYSENDVIKEYKSLATKSYAPGLYAYGFLHELDCLNDEKSFYKAIIYYNLAVFKGSIPARVQLASNIFNDDRETAEQWLTDAAAQGSHRANFTLAFCILNRSLEQIGSDDLERAVNLLSRAADHSFRPAIDLLQKGMAQEGRIKEAILRRMGLSRSPKRMINTL